jgi:hypothetical protein
MRSVGPYWNDEHETRPAVFQGAAHSVAGHGTVLKADAGGSNPQPGDPVRVAGDGIASPGRGVPSRMNDSVDPACLGRTGTPREKRKES